MAEPDTATDAHSKSPSKRDVLLDLADGVATVTLNRPEAMNALDVATKELLLATLQRVAQDPADRRLRVTGPGRAVCRGRDPRGPSGAGP